MILCCAAGFANVLCAQKISVKAINIIAVPNEWKRFGAYYLADDLGITVDNIAGSNAATTEYTVNKKIRIMSSHGSVWSTIPVWRLTDHVDEFECKLFDSLGREVSLKVRDLQRKFMESGKVVVPKTSGGSTIVLKIVFKANGAPPIFEHWFPRAIPVRTGRLILKVNNNLTFSYEAKTRGDRASITETTSNSDNNKIFVWKVSDAMPDDSMSYGERASESEPRVNIRMSPLYGSHGSTVSSWSELASTLNELILEPDLESDKGEISEKAREIVSGKKNDKARAAAIVEWVQQNVVCSTDPTRASVLDVMNGKRSDMVLVAQLCQKMLAGVGIKSDLVLTRAHSRGGFDTDFMTYSGCREGIVIVKFDTTHYAFSPGFTGYPIGTYPVDYFDLSGLNINKQQVVQLPPSGWDRFEETSRATLRLSTDTAKQTLVQTYYQLSAPPVRRALQRHSEGQQHEAVESLLHMQGRYNKLDSFSIRGLGTYDPFVTITSTFTLNTAPVEYANSQRYDLSHFLFRFFGDLDSSRQEDVVFKAVSHFSDTIEIVKDQNSRLELDAQPCTIADSLFTAHVAINQSPQAITVIRDIMVKKGRFPMAKVVSSLGKIAELTKASRFAAVFYGRKRN